MSLKKKLLTGFMVMIAISLLVTGINMYANMQAQIRSSFQSEALVPEILAAEQFSDSLLRSGECFAAYMISFDDNKFAETVSHIDNMQKAIGDINAAINQYGARFPELREKVPELQAGLASYRTAIEDLHTHSSRLPGYYAEMTKTGEEIGRLILQYFKDYRALAANETARLDGPALERRFNRYDSGLEIISSVGDARRKIFELQSASNQDRQNQLYNDACSMMNAILASIKEMRSGTKLPDWIAKCDALIDNINAWHDSTAQINARTIAMNTQAAARSAAYDRLLADATYLSQQGLALIKASSTDISSLIHDNLYVSVFLAVGSVIVGLGLAFFITSSITKPVNQVIEELTAASVATAASGITLCKGSELLADNTANNTATLEETAATLAQMSSMTGKSAENAKKTTEVTISTLERIDEEAQQMRGMAEAMEEINDHSDQISHIIKAIQDIAFQTNLLALNAAVEASRAGEAGKGFAVVADEVRNLAQRSAASVQETEKLIKNTVASVQKGVDITTRLEKGFGEIRNGSHTIGDLVQEISEAASEQAEGLSVITGAVAKIDLATQQISAMTMESADTAHGLSNQTQALNDSVGRLTSIIYGKDGKMTHCIQNKIDNASTPPAPVERQLPISSQM